MAYRYGDREQYRLLPPCIDEYVGPEDPVRAYDVFVEALDLEALGIRVEEEQVGSPAYDPRAMLKLLVYGYAYSADRSSRKLERAVHHNLSFLWLLGGLQPDHKTIANFRRRYREALARVLKQSARMCLRLGIIEGNVLFFDGTKLRANASLKHTWNQERITKTLAKIDRRIEELLQEDEAVEIGEERTETLVTLREELRNQQALRREIEQIARRLTDEGRESVNTIDPECVSTRSIHGAYAGYNAQIAVDETEGLIASCDVVACSTDQGLLSQQIRWAEESLKKPCETAVADAGYSDLHDISTLPESMNVLVPLQRQTEDQDGFIYEETTNTYRCPEGGVLSQYAIDERKKRIRYRITEANRCRGCPRFGTCTISATGRTVGRSFYEATAQRIQHCLEEVSNQAVYRLRAQRVEHPFGHFRRTMAVRSFLLRGIQGAKAELSLYAAAFNIRRMITLLGGVSGFVAKVQA